MRLRLSRRGDSRRRHRITWWAGAAIAAATASLLLSSAVPMATELARARLLTVAGYGHTALLNPSTCVGSYETSYFLTGALPPAGAVCQQDQQPFGLAARP
jgi:hypothetical protein